MFYVRIVIFICLFIEESDLIWTIETQFCVITLKNDWKSNRIFQNRKMVQASTLGPNKHKRGRLRYLGDFDKQKCGGFWTCFWGWKTFEKMTALLKTKWWFKRPRLDQISTSVDACATWGWTLALSRRHIKKRDHPSRIIITFQSEYSTYHYTIRFEDSIY